MFDKMIDRLVSGGHWMSGQFSNWFARSLVMAGWFAVIMAAIYVDFTMGGEYMERWSPKEELDFRFRILGYAMAGAPIVIMAAGFRARRLEAKAVGNFLISFACVLSVFSIAQSVGTMSLTAENMAREAEAFEQVEQTDDELVTELESQRDALNAKIAEREGTLNSEIYNLDNDGKLNEELTEQMRSQRVALQGQQDADLARINARILCLKGDETQCLPDEATGEDAPVIAPLKFDPMVIVINWFTSVGKPNDLEKRWITLIYLTAIGVVICFIGQTLTPFLILTARHANQSANKDPVRVEAGKKAAKTRNRRKRQTDKIEEQAESYLTRWKHAVRLAKNTKYTAKGIAETAFKQGDMEHAITIMKRAGLITDEEIRLVKRSDQNLPAVANPNAVDVINPDPATTNGTGHPTTEGADDANANISGRDSVN